MAVKELPLVESPIRGYMMYGYHLAVTFSHIQAWPWFFSNYVQLQCNSSHLLLNECLDFTEIPKGEIHFTEGTSKYNPWLSNSIQLDEKTLTSYGGSILEYVVDKIKDEYYVETFIDEYYIPQLFNGGNTHFRHRLLIYGYDEAPRQLNIIGFDQNKIYQKLICNYSDFESAFEAITPKMYGRTQLFKPKKDELSSAEFDLEKFVQLTQDYLFSRNTFLNPDLRGDLKDSDKLWYGMKTYQFLEEYTAAVLAQGVIRPDIRGFHIFWEHKKCMLSRLKWMQRAGYPLNDSLITEYQRVVHLSDLNRNRMVMHVRQFSGPQEGHLTGISGYLREAKAIETNVLEQLLTAMAP